MDTSAQPPAAALATQPALVDWQRFFAMQQAAQDAFTPPQSELPYHLVSWLNGAEKDVPMPPNVFTDPTMTYYQPRLPPSWEMRCVDFQKPAPNAIVTPSDVPPFF
jgi:hypothetical protein